MTRAFRNSFDTLSVRVQLVDFKVELTPPAGT